MPVVAAVESSGRVAMKCSHGRGSVDEKVGGCLQVLLTKTTWARRGMGRPRGLLQRLVSGERALEARGPGLSPR